MDAGTARLLARDRGEVDDPPGAAVAHLRADDADAEIGAAQVGREHVVPLLDVDLPEGSDLGARCIVDEHVDLACRLEQVLPGRRGCGRRARPPPPPISAATLRGAASSTSATTTRSPSAASRRAIASPSPRAAPVTTAVRLMRGCARSSCGAARRRGRFARPSPRRGSRARARRPNRRRRRAHTGPRSARSPPRRRRSRAAARASLLVAPAADQRRCRTRRSRASASERRQIELVVVREDHDRGRVVGPDLREGLLRPGHDHSSALGIRSRVANFARASATIVGQPSSFAPAASASAVSTAP